MLPTLTSKKFKFKIPLCFDTLYYVESLDNSALNDVMRQLQQTSPVFNEPDIQPFPFRIQYLSQSELNTDRLAKEMGEGFNSELLEELVGDMRRCLSADKGGTLSARLLPIFYYNNTFEDDHTVSTFKDFNTISSRDAQDFTRLFASLVANKNFKRLNGVTYTAYQKSNKEKLHKPHLPSAIGDIGFVTISPQEMRQKHPRKHSDSSIRSLPEAEKIKSTQKLHLSELSNIIDQYTSSNGIDPIEWLKEEIKKRVNSGKLKVICPIIVHDDKIYLKLSEKEMSEIHFVRGDVPKTLYIFYLKQLKRSKKSPSIPKNVSQAELENYKNELLDIYRHISNRADIGMRNIETWWERGARSNDFMSALSAIKRTFETIFDVDLIEKKYGKIYKIVGTDDKDNCGYSRYCIGLDPDDVTLKWPFEV